MKDRIQRRGGAAGIELEPGIEAGADPGSPAIPAGRQIEHEVPVSEAVVPEAVDYVVYLCGLECYERWKRRSP